MFVISLKLDKNKIYATLATLCLVIAAACVALPERSHNVLNNNISNSAKSTSEHIEFLNAYGYNVNENPIQIQEIVIPSQFSETYEKYNEFQKLSGFDLVRYKNQRVKKYTYKVIDYDSVQDEVVANVLVYNNKIIGGDVSSTRLGGFTHGFIKE